MSPEELIRSGLLEAYVLGQASPDEAALVERMSASVPEIREELDGIEQALEEQALRSAVVPAATVRERVMERIALEPRAVETPVIPISAAPQRSFNWLAAASVVALLLSAGMNFMQYRELHAVRSELARLENDRSVLAQELQVQRTSYEVAQKELAVVTNPHSDVVVLNGLGAAAGKKARIFWDRTANVVHFDALSMPAPPEGTQYQLWALVGGQPVDAGVIGLQGDTVGLQRMKDVPDAQAFAVTIERIGGSPAPTLTALVLMGQV